MMIDDCRIRPAGHCLALQPSDSPLLPPDCRLPTSSSLSLSPDPGPLIPGPRPLLPSSCLPSPAVCPLLKRVFIGARRPDKEVTLQARGTLRLCSGIVYDEKGEGRPERLLTIRRHFVCLTAKWDGAGRPGLSAAVVFNGTSEPHQQHQPAPCRGRLNHCRPATYVLESASSHGALLGSGAPH
jgi:hypothetical protein